MVDCAFKGNGCLVLRREAKWSCSPSEACQGWLDSSSTLTVPEGEWLEGLRAILPKWFLPTRLETRTKESNMYASMLVEKPTCTTNVSDAKLLQQHRPTMIL